MHTWRRCSAGISGRWATVAPRPACRTRRSCNRTVGSSISRPPRGTPRGRSCPGPRPGCWAPPTSRPRSARSGVLTFDMGGTSCDVALIDGAPARTSADHDQRASPAPADARRPHGVGGRRQHRLGRRRRGAARRADLGRGPPGTGLLRTRRRRADGHRRERRPRPDRPRCAPRRWAADRSRTAETAVAALASQTRALRSRPVPTESSPSRCRRWPGRCAW